MVGDEQPTEEREKTMNCAVCGVDTLSRDELRKCNDVHYNEKDEVICHEHWLITQIEALGYKVIEEVSGDKYSSL